MTQPRPYDYPVSDDQWAQVFSKRGPTIHDCSAMSPRDFDAFLRAITRPVDTDEMAHDDGYTVSLDCYEALYADFRAALARGFKWRDERDQARANAKWLLVAAWIVAWAALAWIVGRAK